MKELVVISGKGGTGKTSIVGSFAALADDAILADCDVDAADLHLLMAPTVKETHDFSGGKRASIIGEKCVGCGKCAEMCNFDAIVNSTSEKTYQVDPIACEGCGVCVHFCPADAIDFKDVVNGRWFISDTRFGPMVHARLGIAEENSGKLVTLIRKEAKRIAQEHNRDLLIVDGSPGIGCPVIASIVGSDLVLVVTEPTISGREDLGRVVELISHFGIETVVCINKYDINPEISKAIEDDAKQKGIKVAGKIIYDNMVTKAQVAGKTVIEYCDNSLSQQISSLWQVVKERSLDKNEISDTSDR